MVCRCDDDLTHHLSAEQEMKLNNLKPLQRVSIQIKLTCDKHVIEKFLD